MAGRESGQACSGFRAREKETSGYGNRNIYKGPIKIILPNHFKSQTTGIVTTAGQKTLPGGIWI